MIQVLIGVPGSGKSYFAVDYIYDSFLNEKSKHFHENERVYTNIAEFNFSAFPDGIVYQLVPEELMQKLQMLQQAAVKFNASDPELIAMAKEFGIFNSLFVFDEAHNYFDKDDEVLMWWLTYHRHLNQNIFLITQALQLLNRKYNKLPESFLRAVPSSFRIFGTVFVYKRFISSRMSQSDYVEKVKIKFNPVVFGLYHSGANTQGKKFIFKILAIGALIFVVLVGVFAFYMHTFSSKQPEKKEAVSPKSTSSSSVVSSAASPQKTTQSIRSPVDSNKTLPRDYSTFRILCGANGCVTDDGITITSSDLQNLKTRFGIKLLVVTPFDRHFTFYTYSANEAVYHAISSNFR